MGSQVEGQLRQKDDMGDALHYIDFHQLQIENKQYVSRIEERNDELLKVFYDGLSPNGRRVVMGCILDCSRSDGRHDCCF